MAQRRNGAVRAASKFAIEEREAAAKKVDTDGIINRVLAGGNARKALPTAGELEARRKKLMSGLELEIKLIFPEAQADKVIHEWDNMKEKGRSFDMLAHLGGDMKELRTPEGMKKLDELQSILKSADELNRIYGKNGRNGKNGKR